MKSRKEVQPLGNPATGEVQITLADHKTRTLCFDIDAIYLLEQTMEMDLLAIVAKLKQVSICTLAAFIYAGCWRDAKMRREPWSVERVARELLDLKSVGSLWLKCTWALTHAVNMINAGESEGETSAAESAESRGTTTTR